MRQLIHILAGAMLLLMTCTCNSNHRSDAKALAADSLSHAQLLQMMQTDHGYTLCRVMNPWKADEIAVQYLLVPTADQQWDERLMQTYNERYGNVLVLRTPLQRMTLTSSCHAWLLGQLSALEHIAVMCDTGYVMANDIRQWLRSSSVADGGSSMDPNREVLLASQTDAVWISPYENASTSTLSSLPLTLIYCADYMEISPLARAEWMRFYGRLVDKAEQADSLFRMIETRYDSLIVTSSQETLLAELPYGPTWYVPGGCSTSAILYKDAGFVYPWADDTHAGSLSLSPEAVLVKAMDCDRWIFKYMDAGGDWELSTFVQQHPFYGQFKAAQTGNVWGCNTSYSDFFDVTPFRPDSLLESLINDDERFFKKLK